MPAGRPSPGAKAEAADLRAQLLHTYQSVRGRVQQKGGSTSATERLRLSRKDVELLVQASRDRLRAVPADSGPNEQAEALTRISRLLSPPPSDAVLIIDDDEEDDVLVPRKDAMLLLGVIGGILKESFPEKASPSKAGLGLSPQQPSSQTTQPPPLPAAPAQPVPATAAAGQSNPWQSDTAQVEVESSVPPIRSSVPALLGQPARQEVGIRHAVEEASAGTTFEREKAPSTPVREAAAGLEPGPATIATPPRREEAGTTPLAIVLDALDENHDGSVSREEFMNALHRGLIKAGPGFSPQRPGVDEATQTPPAAQLAGEILGEATQPADVRADALDEAKAAVAQPPPLGDAAEEAAPHAGTTPLDDRTPCIAVDAPAASTQARAAVGGDAAWTPAAEGETLRPQEGDAPGEDAEKVLEEMATAGQPGFYLDKATQPADVPADVLEVAVDQPPPMGADEQATPHAGTLPPDDQTPGPSVDAPAASVQARVEVGGDADWTPAAEGETMRPREGEAPGEDAGEVPEVAVDQPPPMGADEQATPHAGTLPPDDQTPGPSVDAPAASVQARVEVGGDADWTSAADVETMRPREGEAPGEDAGEVPEATQPADVPADVPDVAEVSGDADWTPVAEGETVRRQEGNAPAEDPGEVPEADFPEEASDVMGNGPEAEAVLVDAYHDVEEADSNRGDADEAVMPDAEAGAVVEEGAEADVERAVAVVADDIGEAHDGVDNQEALPADATMEVLEAAASEAEGTTGQAHSGTEVVAPREGGAEVWHTEVVLDMAEDLHEEDAARVVQATEAGSAGAGEAAAEVLAAQAHGVEAEAGVKAEESADTIGGEAEVGQVAPEVVTPGEPAGVAPADPERMSGEAEVEADEDAKAEPGTAASGGLDHAEDADAPAEDLHEDVEGQEAAREGVVEAEGSVEAPRAEAVEPAAAPEEAAVAAEGTDVAAGPVATDVAEQVVPPDVAEDVAPPSIPVVTGTDLGAAGTAEVALPAEAQHSGDGRLLQEEGSRADAADEGAWGAEVVAATSSEGISSETAPRAEHADAGAATGFDVVMGSPHDVAHEAEPEAVPCGGAATDLGQEEAAVLAAPDEQHPTTGGAESAAQAVGVAAVPPSVAEGACREVEGQPAATPQGDAEAAATPPEEEVAAEPEPDRVAMLTQVLQHCAESEPPLAANVHEAAAKASAAARSCAFLHQARLALMGQLAGLRAELRVDEWQRGVQAAVAAAERSKWAGLCAAAKAFPERERMCLEEEEAEWAWRSSLLQEASDSYRLISEQLRQAVGAAQELIAERAAELQKTSAALRALCEELHEQESCMRSRRARYAEAVATLDREAAQGGRVSAGTLSAALESARGECNELRWEQRVWEAQLARLRAEAQVVGDHACQVRRSAAAAPGIVAQLEAAHRQLLRLSGEQLAGAGEPEVGAGQADFLGGAAEASRRSSEALFASFSSRLDELMMESARLQGRVAQVMEASDETKLARVGDLRRGLWRLAEKGASSEVVGLGPRAPSLDIASAPSRKRDRSGGLHDVEAGALLERVSTLRTQLATEEQRVARLAECAAAAARNAGAPLGGEVAAHQAGTSSLTPASGVTLPCLAAAGAAAQRIQPKTGLGPGEAIAGGEMQDAAAQGVEVALAAREEAAEAAAAVLREAANGAQTALEMAASAEEVEAEVQALREGLAEARALRRHGEAQEAAAAAAAALVPPGVGWAKAAGDHAASQCEVATEELRFLKADVARLRQQSTRWARVQASRPSGAAEAAAACAAARRWASLAEGGREGAELVARSFEEEGLRLRRHLDAAARRAEALGGAAADREAAEHRIGALEAEGRRLNEEAAALRRQAEADGPRLEALRRRADVLEKEAHTEEAQAAALQQRRQHLEVMHKQATTLDGQLAKARKDRLQVEARCRTLHTEVEGLSSDAKAAKKARDRERAELEKEQARFQAKGREAKELEKKVKKKQEDAKKQGMLEQLQHRRDKFALERSHEEALRRVHDRCAALQGELEAREETLRQLEAAWRSEERAATAMLDKRRRWLDNKQEECKTLEKKIEDQRRKAGLPTATAQPSYSGRQADQALPLKRVLEEETQLSAAKVVRVEAAPEAEDPARNNSVASIASEPPDNLLADAALATSSQSVLDCGRVAAAGGTETTQGAAVAVPLPEEPAGAPTPASDGPRVPSVKRPLEEAASGLLPQDDALRPAEKAARVEPFSEADHPPLSRVSSLVSLISFTSATDAPADHLPASDQGHVPEQQGSGELVTAAATEDAPIVEASAGGRPELPDATPSSAEPLAAPATAATGPPPAAASPADAATGSPPAAAEGPGPAAGSQSGDGTAPGSASATALVAEQASPHAQPEAGAAGQQPCEVADDLEALEDFDAAEAEAMAREEVAAPEQVQDRA